MLQKVAEGAAAHAVPFFNVFTTVVGGVATAAQISQTIIEVLSSPWVYGAELTRAIDLHITLEPDERWKRFPDLATRYVVRVVYDQGATLPNAEFMLPGQPPRSQAIVVKFEGIPAGGRLKIYVFFYAENGWQAGQGESPWMDAKGTSEATLEVKGLRITTNEVPLGTWSVYVHRSKIAYTEVRGHYWKPALREPPTETITTPSPYGQKTIQRLLSITTAQAQNMVAYAWQASGLGLPPDEASKPPVTTPLYTLQNLSTLEVPDSAYAAPDVGFSRAPGSSTS